MQIGLNTGQANWKTKCVRYGLM